MPRHHVPRLLMFLVAAAVMARAVLSLAAPGRQQSLTTTPSPAQARATLEALLDQDAATWPPWPLLPVALRDLLEPSCPPQSPPCVAQVALSGVDTLLAHARDAALARRVRTALLQRLAAPHVLQQDTHGAWRLTAEDTPVAPWNAQVAPLLAAYAQRHQLVVASVSRQCRQGAGWLVRRRAGDGSLLPPEFVPNHVEGDPVPCPPPAPDPLLDPQVAALLKDLEAMPRAPQAPSWRSVSATAGWSVFTDAQGLPTGVSRPVTVTWEEQGDPPTQP